MDDWPYSGLSRMRKAVTEAQCAADRLDALAALSQLRTVTALFSDVAADLCVIASRAGYTNKRIADALGVRPHTLRGLKEEARARV